MVYGFRNSFLETCIGPSIIFISLNRNRYRMRRGHFFKKKEASIVAIPTI